MSDTRRRALRRELARGLDLGIPDGDMAALVVALRREFVDAWVLRHLLEHLAADLALIGDALAAEEREAAASCGHLLAVAGLPTHDEEVGGARARAAPDGCSP